MTVGEWLKSRRQKLKLSINEVSRETGICDKFLVAMEKGDYDVLPSGQIYIKSYIRSYAAFLSLDCCEAIAYYLQERQSICCCEEAQELLIAQ